MTPGRAVTVGAVVAALSAAVAFAGCNVSRVASQPTAVLHHVGATRTVAAPDPAAVALPDDLTLVATTHGAIPGSPEPGAPQNTVVPATWYGYPSTLPVIDSAPNWVEVRLAQRPNGSTTWVPLSDVTLSSTPYRLVLDLSTEHLAVYEYGKPILDFPAGIGTPQDPTVVGSYFITMRVAPPNPGYGPFVLVTSAHSDAISDWGNSGDAITAIHGPITSYDDGLIGTTGAAISHGCIRLHDADLAQLGNIPVGTPLDIVSNPT
jgi:lipoprotein-anchoring transpeptidase ErfK/SrfK